MEAVAETNMGSTERPDGSGVAREPLLLSGTLKRRASEDAMQVALALANDFYLLRCAGRDAATFLAAERLTFPGPDKYPIDSVMTRHHDPRLPTQIFDESFYTSAAFTRELFSPKRQNF